MPTPPGRWLVARYYERGPGWAATLRQHPVALGAVRRPSGSHATGCGPRDRRPRPGPASPPSSSSPACCSGDGGRGGAHEPPPTRRPRGRWGPLDRRARRARARGRADRRSSGRKPVAAALRLGAQVRAYAPDVDAGLEQTACGGVYGASFGEDSRFYFETEFDWQIFRFFVGSFGLGSPRASSTPRHAFEQGSVADGSCTESSDETGLWVVPLTMLVALRFDYLAEELSIPLVPFFKFG